MIRFIARAKATLARLTFERAVRNPARRQARVWEATRAALQKGTFWPSIVQSSDLKDYPITDYAFYEKVFESDLAMNDHTRLTGEKIIFWAESSGTTGTIKHFPLTRLYQEQFQKVNLPFASAVFSQDPDFFKNSLLYLAAPSAMEATATGIEKGLISGFNYRNIPPLLARKYALPSRLLTDPETYARWASRYALVADVGTIFSIAPSKITALIVEINRRREEFVQWLEEGCTVDADLPRPSLSESRRLELLGLLGTPRDMKPRLTARDLWPRLRLIGCWKTGPCRFQMDELASYVDSDVIRLDAMYTATEAWVNVPLRADRDGGPIHPDAVICEFIEEGKDVTIENLIPMTALEAGKTYEIFVTSLMGLVRYRLYDLVKCTGYYHGSPWIEFVQKSSQVLSLGWTRVSEADLYQAFRELDVSSDPAGKYLVAANAQANGLQVMEFVEEGKDGRTDALRSAPSSASAALDASRFDLALQKVNSYYRSDREKGVVLAAGVLRVPFAQRDRYYGRSHLQSKPTILTKVPV